MTSGGRNVVQMSGQRFGALTVLRRAPKTHRNASWVCRCDCGAETTKLGFRLRQNLVKSCGQNGCIWWNFTPPPLSQTHAPEYRAFVGMHKRCGSKRGKFFKNYRGKGIRVCERWRQFKNFFSDMGKKPTARHTLDRYPNRAGNYEPDNCRWATWREQRHNMDDKIFVEYRGEKVGLVELAEKLGLNRGVLYGRLKNRWSLEDALSAPVRPKRKNPS